MTDHPHIHNTDDVISGNRYKIKNFITRGHNSEVYRAIDTRYDADRAIKIVSPQTTQLDKINANEFRTRFNLEAKLGASLDSNYIVNVYDSFEDEHKQRFYLVMDYMSGGSIRDLLDQNNTISSKKAIEIIIDVTHGLEVLHNEGLTHRDIKPSNILLNKNKQAKIADLGIVQDSKGGTTRTTKDKNRRPPHPGTQAYMSPEQAKEVGYVHPTSDIYSLGCTLFEMLTGVAYVNNKTRIALDDLPEQYPNVPKPLIPILKRMLAELPGDSIAYLDDPTRRYVNVGQVREALEALLTELTSEKTKFTLLTKPILAGITIAIVAVFFGGGLTVLLNGGYPTETPTIIALNGTETTTATTVTTPTHTLSATPTETPTASPTNTYSPSPTNTNTNTNTTTSPPPATSTDTPTHTPTNTYTPSPTNSPLPTDTTIPSATPIHTPTLPITLPIPQLASEELLKPYATEYNTVKGLRWKWDPPLETIPDDWFFEIRFFYPTGSGTEILYSIYPPDNFDDRFGNILYINSTPKTDEGWYLYYFDIDKLPKDERSCQRYWQVAISTNIENESQYCPFEEGDRCRLVPFGDNFEWFPFNPPNISCGTNSGGADDNSDGGITPPRG